MGFLLKNDPAVILRFTPDFTSIIKEFEKERNLYFVELCIHVKDRLKNQIILKFC